MNTLTQGLCWPCRHEVRQDGKAWCSVFDQLLALTNDEIAVRCYECTGNRPKRKEEPND